MSKKIVKFIIHSWYDCTDLFIDFILIVFSLID